MTWTSHKTNIFLSYYRSAKETSTTIRVDRGGIAQKTGRITRSAEKWCSWWRIEFASITRSWNRIHQQKILLGPAQNGHEVSSSSHGRKKLWRELSKHQFEVGHAPCLGLGHACSQPSSLWPPASSSRSGSWVTKRFGSHEADKSPQKAIRNSGKQQIL